MCTRCSTPLGYSLPFRLALLLAYVAIFGKVVYPSLVTNDFPKLLLSLVFALVLGVIARLSFIHMYAPKLQALAAGHTLACPVCKLRFTRRHFIRTGRACPHCKTPVGYSLPYRVLLICVNLLIGAKFVYSGLIAKDFGVFLLAMLSWVVVGAIAQIIVLQTFPPKLQAYAEGQTWLKLTK